MHTPIAKLNNMTETTGRPNGWNEWAKYVLKSIERLETNVSQLDEKSDKNKEEYRSKRKIVLEQLKKDEDLKEIPVVMLTTADNPQEIKYCLDLGCSDYIVKSMKYENFAKVIKDVGLSLLFSIVEMSEIANE